QVKGATILLKDVAHVRDGSINQTNIVRENGRRSAMIMVLKSQGASTLDIVKRVKAVLPRIQQTLPRELNLKYLADQSIFVRASLMSVLKEGLIAAVLTSLMILLFLGSWRSTLIVSISIPLSIVTSVVMLYFLGETLNVMTLGGLALAVGILVDDATVEIENIHRNIGQHKPLKRAILDGAQQIAVAAFVSTLAICIVFVPVVFLKGAPKWLFTPLAMAVVFAMMASYLLSRTLIPTLVMYLLRNEQHGGGGLFQGIHRAFMRGFERMRESYRGLLDWSLEHRRTVVAAFMLFSVGSLALVPMIGQDFFPQVDAGQIRLHVRAPAGTRLEETERIFARVEESIRRVIPAEELGTMLDNIGLPVGGINLAVTDSSMIGPSDGEILISLKEVQRGQTFEYIKQLRRQLKREFPNLTVFFQPADIVSQILNFGLPAAIDVQVMGRNQDANYKIARALEQRIEQIPGAVDVHMQQVANAPEFRLDVDRSKAQQIGFTQRDVANSLLISLSSSGQVAPNFWLNRENSVNYGLSVQTPLYRSNSIDALWNTPVTAAGVEAPQLLRNLAEMKRGTNFAVISHYNVQPVFDIYASVEDRDLGSVADEVDKIVAEAQKKLPRGSFIEMRGQVDSMRSSFVGLGFGLIFAVVLVYFLMVINFQSWLDPFIIMMALPAALAGILWMLFVTQTTISVPSLMGSIMSIGVATANSILLVTFANEQRREGANARGAALEAGYVRLRPVIMTALAMIIGMLPMAFGLGEGGEQNQPLGRAVIGGLVLATFSTLFFVPVVYSVLRKRQPEELEEDAVLLG
ncbi:MAG: efflux RND transporter permease subunit, partial [Acidobacteria bacterium]|nr:efflux RND transporter permease subunit [Acidobacteriota bacterium]